MRGVYPLIERMANTHLSLRPYQLALAERVRAEH
jgi:hypothetical protein